MTVVDAEQHPGIADHRGSDAGHEIDATGADGELAHEKASDHGRGYTAFSMRSTLRRCGGASR